MGFWHTGYMEFHEPVGLPITISEIRPVYRCEGGGGDDALSGCGAEFDTPEGLRKHTFEAHQYAMPMLLVRGFVVGQAPFRIVRTLSQADVVCLNAEQALVERERVSVRELPKRLAAIRNDQVTVELRSSSFGARFTLRFSIASEADLDGVDEAFGRLAAGREFNARRVAGFIQEAAPFASAETYCDGICEYLYGVQAKERIECSIPYDEYRNRFARAADELQDFDRPLARYIRALIAFHWNHFGAAARLSGPGPLREAASRFCTYLHETVPSTEEPFVAPADLTDLDTFQIVDWALGRSADEAQMTAIRQFCRRDIAEFDRAKALLLLGEKCRAAGLHGDLRAVAHDLMSRTGFRTWAERVLNEMQEE